MNLKLFNEGLQWELNEARKNIPNMVRRSSHCILICRDVRKEIAVNSFETTEDEIEFFKRIKALQLTFLHREPTKVARKVFNILKRIITGYAPREKRSSSAIRKWKIT